MTMHFTDSESLANAAKVLTALSDKPPYVALGQIFYCSWGYDQTNIDFYEVWDVRENSLMIEVRGIGRKVVESMGRAGEKVIPDKSKVGGVFKKRIRFVGGRVSFKVADYSRAYLWDGRPRIVTQSH